MKMEDLPRAITAIHSTFFSDPSCVLSCTNLFHEMCINMK